MLFEAVPNFSEGRRAHVIDAIAAATATAHLLDVDADTDHNRVVVSLAGGRQGLVDALVGATAVAVREIDVRHHQGVHPRVGAADVVPVVPLGATALEECRDVAEEIGRRIWRELGVPVYFYGHGTGRRLADIRAGRAEPSLGGPTVHPSAGAVCVGARPALVAFNVILRGADLAGGRALARVLREAAGGMRGVQALAFELRPGKVQLSMNLFRLGDTTPAAVLAELERRGVPLDGVEIVGLCPAAYSEGVAGGKLLEGRLAAAASRAAAAACHARGGEEHLRLAARIERESRAFAALGDGEDELLAGAERAAALVEVMSAAGVEQPVAESMLLVAASGLRSALTPASLARYAARVEALDRRLRQRPG